MNSKPANWRIIIAQKRGEGRKHRVPRRQAGIDRSLLCLVRASGAELQHLKQKSQDKQELQVPLTALGSGLRERKQPECKGCLWDSMFPLCLLLLGALPLSALKSWAALEGISEGKHIFLDSGNFPGLHRKELVWKSPFLHCEGCRGDYYFSQVSEQKGVQLSCWDWA